MEKINKTYLATALLVAVSFGFISFSFFSKQKIDVKQIDGDAIIVMKDDGYLPQNIQIKTGSKVTFVNESSSSRWPATDLHPSHLIYSDFDPKKEISKGGSWTFVFDKTGQWGYHDHLSPNIVGIIEVVDEFGVIKNRMPRRIEECNQEDLNQKQQCWNQILAYTVKHRGLEAAFKLFTRLYQENSSVSKSCHGWAHILGKEGYELYKKNKSFVLRRETSYCGYGFYHGFIEKLIQDTGDITGVKKFCQFAADRLKNDGGIYSGCLHGFGHGSVNIDDPSIWGDFQTMIQPGLDNCEKILPNPEDAGDLRTCWDGAFNAMQQNINDQLYNLELDQNNFFGFCQKQEEKYKISCYFEFVGLLSRYAEHNFKKASDILLSEEISEDIAEDSILKLSADFMQDDIINPSQEKNVIDCRLLKDSLYKKCFEGILSGFYSHGEPEKQYIKTFAFCNSEFLTDEEEKFCYEYTIKVSIPAGSKICRTVPKDYQEFCFKRS